MSTYTPPDPSPECRYLQGKLAQAEKDRARVKARIRWLEAMLQAKDLLLVAHRVQDHDLADRALSKIEKLEAAGRGEAVEGPSAGQAIEPKEGE